MSVKGSHCIAILKVSKANYGELLSGLKDIINEIRDLQCVTITDTLFKMKYYLGRYKIFSYSLWGRESYM